MGLERLFDPSAIAVIGASRDVTGLGGRAISNIAARPGGAKVFPVNPAGGTIGGLEAYPDLAAIRDGPIDLAYIIVRADLVPDAIEQCGRRNIPFAIVASSGFGEAGASGDRLEGQIIDAARAAGVRIVGPNTNGVWNPKRGLSVGFNISHEDDIPPGNISVVAQSGALLGSMLRRLVDLGAGVSCAVATGNEADLQTADYVEYLAEDVSTTCIVLLLDALKDTRRFGRAVLKARRAGKDVVALKFGQTSAGRKAAELHSSRIAGQPESFSALMSRLGIVEATDLDSLVGAAALLGRRPQGYGVKVTGVSMSGAGASLLADLVERHGLRLPEFSTRSVEALSQMLKYTAVHNPLDTTGQSADEPWLRSLFEVIADDDPDSSLVYVVTLVPEKGRSANRVLTFADVMGDRDRRAVVYSPTPLPERLLWRLHEADVPVFANGPECLSALSLAARATTARATTTDDAWLRFDLDEGPAAEAAVPDGHRLRSHDDVRPLLERIGIKFPRELVVDSPGQAVEAARDIGENVVLKLLADDLVHKRDVGGVILGLRGGDEVAAAYRTLHALGRVRQGARVLVQQELRAEAEFLVGYRFDDQAGPIVLVGFGGSQVEQDPDVGFGVAPLDDGLVETMITSLRGAPGLRRLGVPYESVIAAVVPVVVAFSRLVGARWNSFESLEINPLSLVRTDKGVALVAIDVRASARPAGWVPQAGWGG